MRNSTGIYLFTKAPLTITQINVVHESTNMKEKEVEAEARAAKEGRDPALPEKEIHVIGIATLNQR